MKIHKTIIHNYNGIENEKKNRRKTVYGSGSRKYVSIYLYTHPNVFTHTLHLENF